MINRSQLPHPIRVRGKYYWTRKPTRKPSTANHQIRLWIPKVEKTIAYPAGTALLIKDKNAAVALNLLQRQVEKGLRDAASVGASRTKYPV
jgi:hypothetical protein